MLTEFKKIKSLIKTTTGFAPLVVSQLIVIALGSLLYLLSYLFFETEYQITDVLISIFFNVLSLILLALVFFCIQRIIGMSTSAYEIKSDASANLLYPIGLLFIFLTGFVDFHVLGVEGASQSNLPFLEGFMEILMRYIIPSICYIYLTNVSRKKLLSLAFLCVLVIYTLYIDVSLKGSKHVALTYVLLYALHAVVNDKLISIKAFVVVAFAVVLTIYIYTSRTLGFDSLDAVGVDLSDSLYSKISNAMFERTVGISESSMLIKNIALVGAPPEIPSGYSIANVYTQEYYNIPLGSGTSNATGFLGFHLYSFGMLGILFVIPTAIFIKFLYIVLAANEAYRKFTTIIIDLFVIYLMVDGTLDERLYSSFPVKLFAIMLFMILISIFIRELILSQKRM